MSGDCHTWRSLVEVARHRVDNQFFPNLSAPKLHSPSPRRRNHGRTIFGYPRDFLDNEFVYLTVSPSARGLAIGVNLLPAPPSPPLDLATLARELRRTLELVQSDALASRPGWNGLSTELRQLRHVALSGDTEPTQSPRFAETLEVVTHARATRGAGFFKIVLVTDGTRLDGESVRTALRSLTVYDEIWWQLDVIDAPKPGRRGARECDPARALANASRLGRERPIVVQSFVAVEPPPREIDTYVSRLLQLVSDGAEVTRVQIYSVPEFRTTPKVRPLSLGVLSTVAEGVRAATGLVVEVF